MINRRTYWYHNEALNIAERDYNVESAQALLRLSAGLEKFNIDSKQGIKCGMIFYRNEWLAFINNANKYNYLKLLKLIKKFYNNLNSYNKSIVLHNLNHITDFHFLCNFPYNTFATNKVDLNNDITKKTNFYLDSNFDIHFIRLQKHYNKRRYGRQRAISRPSFWSGSLLGCTGIGMFWGSTMQFTDWVLVQPIIIDINVILFLFYILVIARYFQLVVTRKTRFSRDNSRIMHGWFYSLVINYLNKLKWFK